MVRPFIWAGCFLPALAAYPERRERRRSSCLALLRTGFAVPSLLPWTRCALAAPFHPCRPEELRLRRYVFCGAVRRLAAPGSCPAFLLFGVRTFLPFAFCQREKAAARPTRLRGIIALIRRMAKFCIRRWRRPQRRSGVEPPTGTIHPRLILARNQEDALVVRKLKFRMGRT